MDRPIKEVNMGQFKSLMTSETDINAAERARLEALVGQVWDTAELQRDFTVIAFQAPFVVVVKKSTGEKGSLEFQHLPRFYYAFTKA